MVRTPLRDLAVREFHVARAARDRYRFDQTLFSLSGNVVFADFHAARVFAARINSARDLVSFPERAVSAGEINAMGLIDELLHAVVAHYRDAHPGVISRALEMIEKDLGAEAVKRALYAFATDFPPGPVYRGEVTLEVYINGDTGGVPHREVVLEELLLLWLANLNPAFAPHRELFEDSRLRGSTAYLEVMEGLREFFASEPRFGPGRKSLVDMLRAPALASPHSLEGQLEYIRSAWLDILGPMVYRLLASLDLLAEEQKPFFGFGPGPVRPPDFAGLDEEVEAYSLDRDWMPRLVLLAKNAYVWLDQLSKRYETEITRLDQIPDEELDTLSGWGFTGLWLIGVWERSRASRRIKQMMGDTDAVASAYSLQDYRVAADLGGEEAFDDLKDRAFRRGIRMSTDMVPNHVGIDSRWVIEHPDWFIGLDYSPFPAYTFDGPDLCDDQRVGIYLEDHYYTRSDAAVVFKRVDQWTGNARFIYHGNDGTSMPWNDTAQLDYRNPEVREAVIQTILHVARRSPVIRFDAAMTLAKKHYHRLWFPEPGSGGDIPSRADCGLTRAEFDASMPNEFWREVVDRVAAEVPDTLLLAEAFWLLEGYFVRTLGMHRVYNSAFMNMLRDEKNADYRELIKSTLEFDPQILKRYVNFMSNPDERTAIDQFGTDGKYFGVATLMVTMPGLPMFGHGQIEGFTEKYGMEFRRPRWQEEPDGWLVERHERQLFPLLHRRHLFADVDRFLLYDFFLADGSVDENVFAYSNACGSERSLVLYHNRFAETRGWIRSSTAVAVRGDNGERSMVQHVLSEGLAISGGEDRYLVFRDAVNGLEYIRGCGELVESGLYVVLEAYDAHVFLDFREVVDGADHRYRELELTLAGRGVPSIDDAMTELFLAPVLEPYRRVVSASSFERLVAARPAGTDDAVDAEVLGATADVVAELVQAIRDVTGASEVANEPVTTITNTVDAVLRLPAEALADDSTSAASGLDDDPEVLGVLLAWALTHALGAASDPEEAAELTRSWLDEWLLGTVIADTLRGLGASEATARRAVGATKLMIVCGGWHRDPDPHRVLVHVLGDPELQAWLGINRHGGVLWFHHENFTELIRWLGLLAAVETTRDHPVDADEKMAAVDQALEAMRAAESASGYRVDRLLDGLKVEG